MLRQLLVQLILFYQRHLSPRKGYRCAYGAHTGRHTCSSFGLRAVRKAGAVRGLRLIQRQFDRCALAAAEMRVEQASLRRAPTGPLRHQRGFVDCDCGDVAGCDLPSCDAPSCDAPSCGSHGKSGVLRALDIFGPDCCCSAADVPSCGGSRSEKARQRVAERARKREERRNGEEA